MTKLLANAAVGFSVAYGLTPSALARWRNAHEHVLGLFPWLNSIEMQMGETIWRLWSHGTPSESICHTQSAGVLLLSGSPLGKQSWTDITQQMVMSGDMEFSLPCDGRCVLMQISADGQHWDLWNDWAAALTVFHASQSCGSVVSTLETIVVQTTDLSPDRFSKRGLVELLLLGQFLGTDTLYEPMEVVKPDSHVIWQQGKLKTSKRLWTVQASDAHYSTSRPILLDTLHDLTCQAVSGALASEESPILLPLSSGMDSRLIACVAAENHLQVEAFSYGSKEWAEVYFARQIAEAFKFPGHNVDLGVNYRADFVRNWLDWFGSSLHAHGMYQFPFLKCIEGRGGMIPNGFYGNNMAGGDHPNDCLFQKDKNLLDRFCGYSTYWDKQALKQLLDFDPGPCYVEMNDLLQEQVMLVSDWPEYQQMNAIDMWNRQARFISYQPTMYSYFGYERSPFMHRGYARFCMSLPPELLRKRSLQIEMLDRYWPQISKIGGTFRPLHGTERIWHGIRYRVAIRLPRMLRPLMGVTWLNNSDPDCATTRKWENFFPVSPTQASIGPLISRPITEAAQRAISGDPKELAKVVAVQPVLFRLLHGNSSKAT